MSEATTINSKEKVHSKAPEMEQSLTVALRIRPINEDEIVEGATPIAHAVENNMVVLMDPMDDPDDVLRVNRSREKHYVFDVAFDGSATQKEVYEQTSKALIPGVIEGFNATVFAYGATGAGKTYTMLGTDDEPGIMAQTLNELFQTMSQADQDMSYKVTMSYLEIYNEMIRDLLNPSSGFLELREDAKGVQVAGLSEISAKTTREVMDILVQGNKERTCEPTAANKASSRSHAVFQVTVRQRQRMRGTKQEVKQGKLFLIDLAGSERAANTHNTGKRMVEGAHINRSLLALGNCINALSDKNGSRYVNYRDSKLTRLLKEALGGNCRTVMIAHVSPASIHFEESRNTLVYADRAKHIKTKVRRNVMDVSYHIAQYTNIISELREEIKRLRTKLDKAPTMTLEDVGPPGGNTEVKKLKERLVSVFKEQMEMRRSLMDLNNTAMEISLDTTRNRLVLKRWEREKGLCHKRKEIKDHESDVTGPDTEAAVFLTEQKDLELRGESPAEPEDVKVARQDLQVLRKEKELTDKIHNKISKELQAAKDRAAKIEDMLPRIVSSADQQEVLSLLCRVHELEIENMEMQSACLLSNFEIRKIDMIVSKYEQHRQLCDEIIYHQRTLLDKRDSSPPKDLEELYELYMQETGEIFIDKNVPSLPDINEQKKPHMDALSSVSRKLLDVESLSDFTVVDNQDLQLTLPDINNSRRPSQPRRLYSNSMTQFKEEKTGALFSHSPRAKEIYQQQAKENAATNSRSKQSNDSHNPHRLSPYSHNHLNVTRQQSIITLTTSSSSPTPPQGSNSMVDTLNRTFSVKNESSPLTSIDSVSTVGADGNNFPTGAASINPKQRQIIATSTRNIHALALKRRSMDPQAFQPGGNDDTSQGRYEEVGDIVTRGNDNNVGSDYSGSVKNEGSSASNSGALTESLLEQHNKKYGNYTGKRQAYRGVVGGELTEENEEEEDELRDRFEPTQAKHTGSRKVYPPGGRQQQYSQRSRSQDKHMGYQQLSKTTPRHNVHKVHNLTNQYRKSRLPAPRKVNATKTQNLNFNLDGFMEMTTSNDETSRSEVKQVNTERGQGHTVQRKVRGPRVKKSMNFPEGPVSPTATNTNNSNSKHKANSKRRQQAASKYGHADIDISGFGLH